MLAGKWIAQSMRWMVAILLAGGAMYAAGVAAQSCPSPIQNYDCSAYYKTPWVYDMTQATTAEQSPAESVVVGRVIAKLAAYYAADPNSCGYSATNNTGDWLTIVASNGDPTFQRREGQWTFVAMTVRTPEGCSPGTTLGLYVYRRAAISCPDPDASAYSNPAVIPTTVCIKPRNSCEAPAPLCPKTPTPISAMDGVKTLSEVDFVGAGPFPLRFERHYAHGGLPPAPGATANPVGQFGYFWRHTYQRSVAKATYGSATMALVLRPQGGPASFSKVGTVYQPTGVAGAKPSLSELVNGGGQTTGWVYQERADEIETFDAAGRLLSIVQPGGSSQTLAYDGAGRLQSITDTFGRQLTLTYDSAQRIQQLTDSGGGVHSYSFDDWTDNLAQVTHPGGGVRTYLYGEAAYVGTPIATALTGVVDENGTRFSIYRYASNRRATSSVHLAAPGTEVNRFTVNSTAKTITDPLGTTRTFAVQTVNQVARPTSVTQPCATPGCLGNQTFAATYDSGGNLASRTDFNGKRTCYAYDTSRNLETARVEGALSSEACATVLTTLPGRVDVRKTSTQWHAIWRQPTKVAEPNRVTTYTYNGDGGSYCAPPGALVNGVPLGVVCSRVVQQTTDSTGQQGLAATTTGTARTWQYTYNATGQVLTATDPNAAVTTTTYYAANDPDVGKRGNVSTVTNPLGHVLTYTSYDLAGRTTAITDANGLVTTLAYHPRGWLTARTTGGETTTYAYDPVGQLTSVTQPDGSSVQYTYDGAHRLTQVADGLGNRIVYTLDAAGNRIKEQAYDPAGTLARTRQQVFDGLNRVHQSVGAQ